MPFCYPEVLLHLPIIQYNNPSDEIKEAKSTIASTWNFVSTPLPCSIGRKSIPLSLSLVVIKKLGSAIKQVSTPNFICTSGLTSSLFYLEQMRMSGALFLCQSITFNITSERITVFFTHTIQQLSSSIFPRAACLYDENFISPIFSNIFWKRYLQQLEFVAEKIKIILFCSAHKPVIDLPREQNDICSSTLSYSSVPTETRTPPYPSSKKYPLHTRTPRTLHSPVPSIPPIPPLKSLISYEIFYPRSLNRFPS
ncbi:hypothetical protein OXYTRIMIC_172 [Oxytricha trifallax]|uniref:Uncharacterized protein n=1 Tax=Oxytricha trifallax TaxID=1172189 RepID=A0A073HX60_9SPIT|nr:hypothetical protein OXYTRIMIC_172 [Oxytricha trifallax]